MIYATELALLYRQDVEPVQVAALLHDAFRDSSTADFYRYASEFAYSADAFENGHPVLLHGPLAACWAAADLGITDQAILDAIRFHTTGSPGLGAVATVVYIADALEPGRSYPAAPDLRQAIEKLSLQEAALLVLKHGLQYLINSNEPISPLSVLWYNELLRSGYGESMDIEQTI